jgi:tRNA (cmo5U34)-methyltransferase
MAKPAAVDHFTKDASRAYDERNRKLSPISGNLHFLIELVLGDLPPVSHVLCVGVGTGAEILHLAKVYPQWTFVGADPSASMLEVCGERLKEAGLSGRCELIHGYVQDVPAGSEFDAALSVLVAHFVKTDERLDFFQNMTKRLRAGGVLVNAELSFDLNSLEFPAMLANWEKVQALMGLPAETLANLPLLLRENLSVLSPEETEAILRQSGIEVPVRFFQAFMIFGWHGRKGAGGASAVAEGHSNARH